MIRHIFLPLFVLLATASLFAQGKILDPQSYKHYIDTFNANDNELYKGYIPNSESWQFLSEKIPLTVNPLVPLDKWDYFCLDNLPYKGHKLSVLYDKDGSRYGMGQGFKVFVDGVLKGEKPTVEKIVVNLEDV